MSSCVCLFLVALDFLAKNNFNAIRVLLSLISTEGKS